MSEAKELLGRWVYYFDDPRVHIAEPVPAQIVRLTDKGACLMVPNPIHNWTEYKNFIEHSYTPKAYHWIDIEDYEEWKEDYDIATEDPNLEDYLRKYHGGSS